jgi:hypothetical protein
MTTMRVAHAAITSIFGCAASLVFMTACGDVYADPDPEVPLPTTSVADGGVIVTDAPAVFPQDSLPLCPKTRPRENSSCPLPGSTCEYGSSADSECNTTLACEGSQFEAAWAPRPRGTCFSDVCPESGDVASLDGKPCALESDSSAITDADEAVCNMTDGVCACTTGRDGASRHERRWTCVRPISVCPPNRPVLGSACEGTLWCDYGSCAFKRGAVMECVQGLWLTGGATCE